MRLLCMLLFSVFTVDQNRVEIWYPRIGLFTGCCCCITSIIANSVQPQRQQPTRLPHPWDSPGKNTGVGCHFLLQCMKVKSESEVAQLCPALRNPMDCSLTGSSIHGIFQARVLEWGAIAFSVFMGILAYQSAFDQHTLNNIYQLTCSAHSLCSVKPDLRAPANSPGLRHPS